MPSSIYLGAYASHPELLGDEGLIWEQGDWFDPQSDSGLGDYNPMMENPSGPSTPADTATVTSSYMTCEPNEVLVNNPDWAAPVCMTSQMALSYGAGLQAQKTAAAPLLGIPSSALPWLIGGGFLLLLVGFGGGRRR